MRLCAAPAANPNQHWSGMQDFARNQVGAQLNTLASSVLTLEPESEGHADRHLHGDIRHIDGSHAAAQWAAPDSNGKTAVFEGFDSDLPAEHHSGTHAPHGHHAANGSSSGTGDFQDVPLHDAPPEAAAKALSPPRKGAGAAAALSALREENAVLTQRLAAVEAVSIPWILICNAAFRPRVSSTDQHVVRNDVAAYHRHICTARRHCDITGDVGWRRCHACVCATPCSCRGDAQSAEQVV